MVEVPEHLLRRARGRRERLEGMTDMIVPRQCDIRGCVGQATKQYTVRHADGAVERVDFCARHDDVLTLILHQRVDQT